MNSFLKEKILTGVIWSLIQNWGARLGTLAVFMILAHILSPSESGLFAAATTVLAFSSIFVESDKQSFYDQYRTSNFYYSHYMGVGTYNLQLHEATRNGVDSTYWLPKHFGRSLQLRAKCNVSTQFQL